ncbi:MAG: large subunit ribosomal protein L9 [Chloroflexi bacterium]|nr:MAG: large subunit ribosomal protein L9 [Chloroflexota bacterium]
MKVLLIKDVYKLGHAGDVKKVADGYGRNFLLPQGLAVLATAGALKTVEKIQAKAAITRAAQNQEMSGLAEHLEGVELSFATKAGETGKLYGSITSQMIVDALNQKLGTQIERHQIEAEPIRNLGEHVATVRLTIDLNPKIKVVVTREGESSAKESAKPKPKVEITVEPAAEEPKAEEPKAEEPIEPVAEEPKAEEPKAEEPIEPVAEEPKAEEPVESAAEEPKAEVTVEEKAE